MPQDPTTPLSAQHYRGVYMLQEKVSRGKDRVEVKKYDPEVDPSGETALFDESGRGHGVTRFACHCSHL